MTVKKPVFSIITVNYNCANGLSKTIESVLKQRFDNYEYIVIDGESTDESIEVIKKYQNSLAYWCSEPDKGIYDAMNKGIAHAHGEWIIFLNSSDIFANNDVLDEVEQHVSSSDYDIVYGDIVKEVNGVRIDVPAHEPCNFHHMFFCHQSCFVRTELMRKYSFDCRFKYSADFNFFKKCYKDGCVFLHLHSPLICYDFNGVSNQNRKAALRDNIAVIKGLDSGLEKWMFIGRLRFSIMGITLSQLFG